MTQHREGGNLSASLLNEHDVIKEDETSAACSTHGDMINAYNIFVGKLQWRGPLRRSWRRSKVIIRMDITEIGWEGVDCTQLSQDRNQWWALMNTVINLWAP
jgi:hypothetical protein